MDSISRHASSCKQYFQAHFFTWTVFPGTLLSVHSTFRHTSLHGQYFQAHFFTWTTGEKELSHGINLCPLVVVPNVTTTDIRNYMHWLIMFHVFYLFLILILLRDTCSWFWPLLLILIHDPTSQFIILSPIASCWSLCSGTIRSSQWCFIWVEIRGKDFPFLSTASSTRFYIVNL